jgi:4a-hydroxytetrahydrobiopterin dehydratase
MEDRMSTRILAVGELRKRHCIPCEGGVAPLDPGQIETMRGAIPDWTVAGNRISRSFRFRDFSDTMAFVNAVAWVAHREDHHPDLEVGYSNVRVTYWTHAIGGLSENDFICAARNDALLQDE